MRPTVCRLTPNDAEASVALRQEMLAESPWAFLASPEDDRGSDIARVREHLASTEGDATFGAFDPELVGVVSVLRDRHRKASHKLHLVGMFVVPDFRRQGLGRRLFLDRGESRR